MKVTLPGNKTLFKGSLIVLSANIIGGILNYLYHPLAAHFLTPGQFGLFESFIALNYFLAVFSASFAFSVIYFVNQYTGVEQTKLIQSLQSVSIKLTFFTWIAALLSYFPIKYLLHLTNPYLFLVFSIQILFAYIPTLYTSVLQAKLKFGHYSLINVFSPLLKLILTLSFLYAGLQVTGAFMGLVLAAGLTALLGYYLASQALPHHKSQITIPDLPVGFWTFFWSVFIAQASFTSLYNSDIILSRYYFPTQQSGIYAAASVMSRSIFFLSAMILAVAYPLFTMYKNNRHELKRTYLWTVGMTLMICVIGSTALALFPRYIIGLFFGMNYLLSIHLLLLFVVLMSCLSMLNINFQYMMMIKPTIMMKIVGLTALAQIIVIYMRHDSPIALLQNSLTTVNVGLVMSFYFVGKSLYGKKQ